MTSTSEFWKAWNNRKPQKLVKIEYRVYYDGSKVLFARSDPSDCEWPAGDYIFITKQTYKEWRGTVNYRVIDGELVEVKRQASGLLQLEQAEDGTLTSLKNNIIFAAKKGDNYKQKEYNVEISSTRKL